MSGYGNGVHKVIKGDMNGYGNGAHKVRGL
jgi:hypothetical protein